MKYDVSRRGIATNLKIVEAHPREFVEMQHQVQRELRRRIYRPQFDDAVADYAELGTALEMTEIGPDAPTAVPPLPGRNDPCPCGSGKKFKKCCGR